MKLILQFYLLIQIKLILCQSFNKFLPQNQIQRNLQDETEVFFDYLETETLDLLVEIPQTLIKENVTFDIDQKEQIFSFIELNNGKYILQYAKQISDTQRDIGFIRIDNKFQQLNEFTINSNQQFQTHGNSCRLPSGDYVAVWTENNVAKAQLYNGVTDQIIMSFIVDDEAGKINWQCRCDGFLNGQIIIVYTKSDLDKDINDDYNGDIYFKIFNRQFEVGEAGFVQHEENASQSRAISFYRQRDPQVIVLQNQGFIIVFESYVMPRRQTPRWEVWQHQYQGEVANFAEIQPEYSVSVGHSPTVGITSDGYIIAYTEGDLNGGMPDIFQAAYLMNDLQNPLYEQLQVNVQTPGYQNATSIIVFDDDTYLILWSGQQEDTSIPQQGIYGRFYVTYDQPAGGDFLFTIENTQFSYLLPFSKLIQGINKRFIITYLNINDNSIYSKIYQYINLGSCPSSCQTCQPDSYGYSCVKCQFNKDPFNDCLTCDFQYPQLIDNVCYCENGYFEQNDQCVQCHDGMQGDNKGGCKCKTGLEDNGEGGCRPSFEMNVDSEDLVADENDGENETILQEESPRIQKDPEEVNSMLLIIVIGALLVSCCFCCICMAIFKRRKNKKKNKSVKDKIERKKLLQEKEKQQQEQENINKELEQNNNQTDNNTNN